MRFNRQIIGWFTGFNLIFTLAVSNLIVSNLPKVKLDLTRDRIYTLSESSRSIVEELPDRVRVDAYLSSQLPPQFKQAADDLKTILNEASRINPNKLKVSYFDPSTSQEAKTEAQKLGVEPLQFNVMNNDKFEISQGYLGMVVNYADKKEVIPVVGNVENLEYALMGTISSLVNPKKGNVAISVVDQPRNANDGFELIKALLARVFPEVESINIESGEKPSGKSLAWMVILSAGSVGESTVEVLEEWQKQGKPLMLLVDKVAVNESGMGTQNDWGQLTDWLKAQGAEVESRLVADMQSNAASIRTSNGPLLTQYAYWPITSRKQMNQEIPAVSGVDSLGFFWVSPLSIGKNYRPLVKSSPQSWSVEAGANLSPGTISVPKESEFKEFILGAVKTEGSRMVLFGDTDWIRDSFVSNNRNSPTVVFNLLDYLTADEKLINIRTKNISFQPLPNWSKDQKNWYRAANIGAVVVMLAGVAGISFIYRKRRNAKNQ